MIRHRSVRPTKIDESAEDLFDRENEVIVQALQRFAESTVADLAQGIRPVTQPSLLVRRSALLRLQ